MNQSFQQARCGCEVEPEVTRVVEDRPLESELGNASGWLVRQLRVSYGSMVEQHPSAQHLEAVAPARLKGRFPSSQAQFCTEELKTNPIIEQIALPMLKRGPVIQWIGQRREESLRRSKLPRFNRHESGSLLWRPILEWRLPRVWRQHSRHGILPNPLYAMGFKRVGCYPCINCRKEEVRLIGSLSPEHIDRIELWEWVLGKASKRQRSSFFSAGTDPTDTEGAPIRQIVEWSLTGRGGRQFDMFFAAQAGAGCTSDLALCERAA